MERVLIVWYPADCPDVFLDVWTVFSPNLFQIRKHNSADRFFFLAPHTFIARSAYISHQTSGSSVWSHVKRHMCDGTDLSALLQSALFSAIMSRNELGFSFFFDRYFP